MIILLETNSDLTWLVIHSVATRHTTLPCYVSAIRERETWGTLYSPNDEQPL